MTGLQAMAASIDHRQLAPDISCSYLPEGVARMQWDVDSRRLGGRSTTVVSPAFPVDVPGLGRKSFKLVVNAAANASAGKRGCNFQATGGHASIELKCESRVPDDTYVVVLRKPQGARLGMDLEAREGGLWTVKAIGSGLVEQWNQEHSEEMRVSVGDSILEVNGVSGDLAKVREACGQLGSVSLLLRRAKQAAWNFDLRFGIGGGAVPMQPMLGPVRNDVATESCCGLRTRDQVWDLLSAADRRAKKVRIVCELTKVQSVTSRS
jgi:hypothetical protein